MRSFTGKKIWEKIAVRGSYVGVLFLKALETNWIDKIAQLVDEKYLPYTSLTFSPQGPSWDKGQIKTSMCSSGKASSASSENLMWEYWDRRSALTHSVLNHSTLDCNYWVWWLILQVFQENSEEEIWIHINGPSVCVTPRCSKIRQKSPHITLWNNR